MEFYSLKFCLKSVTPKVSIPNGMEFYIGVDFSCNILLVVSIPNGMEFYPFPPALKPRKYSFNSQRDGILRGLSSPEKSNKGGFNSQRDGILHDPIDRTF